MIFWIVHQQRWRCMNHWISQIYTISWCCCTLMCLCGDESSIVWERFLRLRQVIINLGCLGSLANSTLLPFDMPCRMPLMLFLMLKISYYSLICIPWCLTVITYPEPTCWGKLEVMDLDCFPEELWLGSPCNLKPASWCANVASMAYGSATSLHRWVTIWFSVFWRRCMWDGQFQNEFHHITHMSLLTYDPNVRWAKISTGSSWLCLGCCLLRELVDHLVNARWWHGVSELQ